MNRKTHRGFSLVELLIVVSIIGILTAILLPALQHSRQFAQTTTCTANLRNSVLWMLNYADDYNGLLTPFQDVNYLWPNSPWPGPQDTENAGGFYWYKLLRWYNYGRGSFICPSGIAKSWHTQSPAYGFPTDHTWFDLPWPDTQTNPISAWFFEDRSGTPELEISIDRTNYAAASTYHATTWNFNDNMPGTYSWPTAGSPPGRPAPRLGPVEALPMIDFWWYSDADVQNRKQSWDSLRKPTINQAYKPAQTAVLYDGIYSFRFDRALWSSINLRHNSSSAANFSFIDGHVETRDWTIVPPGYRTPASGPQRLNSQDPITAIDGQIQNGWEDKVLRALIDKPTDENTIESPVAATWGLRFVVPKTTLIYNGVNYGD